MAADHHIYAPVLHGIGERDHEDFADSSVRRIVAHLDRPSSEWSLESCPALCAGFSPGHEHLRHAAGARLTVDPISWFSLSKTPSRRAAARWLVRTLFVLCCVHLLVNGRVFLEFASMELPGIGHAMRHPWQTVRAVLAATWRVIRAMLWILAIGILTLLLVVLVTPVLFVWPHLQRLTADALGWTSDDATRESVITHVTARVTAPMSDHTVLIGHSQGAAIAATVARTSPPARTTLVTLGSGLAVLAPIRATGTVSGWMIAALTLAIISYVGLIALGLWQLLVAAVSVVATAAFAIIQGGAALWSLVTAPSVSVSHMAMGLEATARTTGAALLLEPDWRWLLIALPLGVVIAVTYRAVVHPIASRVVAECRVDAPGVDLCATFDPVSHPLTVLGNAHRIRRISQSGSLADHVRYFANRVEVLREIEAQVTRLAHRSPPRTAASDPAAALPSDDAIAAEAKATTRLDRIARTAATFGTAVVALAALPHLPWVALLLALAVYALGTVAKHVRWARRQRTDDSRLLRAWRCRPHHAWFHVALALFAGSVMFGAVVSPAMTTTPVVATVAFVLLGAGGVAALGYSRWMPWLLAGGLSAAAVVWANQSTPLGTVAALACAAGGAIYVAVQVVRLRRASPPRPPRRGSSSAA